MTNLKSDDTDDCLTVVTAQDGDMWVGINQFNLVRFRNGIGGGMCPHTYVALRNLEVAMKKDMENRENGISSVCEWTKALKDLKPTDTERALASVREQLADGLPEWETALTQVAEGDTYEEYLKNISSLGHTHNVNRATYDIIKKMYKKAL